MQYKNLLKVLKNYGNISETDEKNIRRKFKFLTVNKKQILVNGGSFCDKLFFVNKGLLRAYYYDNTGKELTRMIAWENRFLTNVASFRKFEDNKETIECIENAELLYITKFDFDNLIKSSLNFKIIYADILEEYNALHIKRFEQLNTRDALGKLEYFKINFPALKNRINDTYLSSFLSISRRTLERIKKNI